MPRRTEGKIIFDSESEYSAVRLQYRDRRVESEFPAKFRAKSESDELSSTPFINPVYISSQIFIAGHPQKSTSSKPPSSNNPCKSAKFRRFHILAAKNVLEIGISNFLSTIFLEFLNQACANCHSHFRLPSIFESETYILQIFPSFAPSIFLIVNIFLNLHLC